MLLLLMEAMKSPKKSRKRRKSVAEIDGVEFLVEM